MFVTAVSRKHKSLPSSISVAQYRAIQILLVSINGCYGNPCFALIHVLSGSFIVGSLAIALLHRLSHGLVLVFLCISMFTAGLILSYVTYNLSANLFSASIERLRKFKLHYGKHRGTKPRLNSLPLLCFKSGWSFFKYFSSIKFLLLINACVNYLILILLFPWRINRI